MTSPVFQEPPTDAAEQRVIDLIEAARERLRSAVAEPRRWTGTLRRDTAARAVRGSIGIEGYHASVDDVLAIEEGEEPLDTNDETRLATEGYQRAMTYVLQLARDGNVVVDEGTLKALHFMMIQHDMSHSPGIFRKGPVWVRREDTGEQVYEGPPNEIVDDLVDSMLRQLHEGDDRHVLVRAAMAHLNLVMIHPFRDGNGRMARALQTLVLAQDRILAREFSSIEEYLGRNTPAYYQVLEEVGQGRWNPGRDARPWVRFCLKAHLQQAATLENRIGRVGKLWILCSDLVAQHGLPERCIGPIFEMALGRRLRNQTYRRSVDISAGEEITDQTATRDLGRIVAEGLIEPVGERRGRVYLGRPLLTGVARRVREEFPGPRIEDPFVGDDQDAAGQVAFEF